MGFLAPWFLAGLATVGLPVYLHLLRRHATTPRPFSSLRFFERRQQSSIRHRRLRYLLLLSLRLALLVLLVLAFANPFVNRMAASVAAEAARSSGRPVSAASSRNRRGEIWPVIGSLRSRSNFWIADTVSAPKLPVTLTGP